MTSVKHFSGIKGSSGLSLPVKLKFPH